MIGPSGAGKSTLLGTLTGMRPANAGSVAMQLLLAAVLTGLTWWRLHRANPGRRR